jgi:bisphosphoglycerate-independent phosphoglycerate mutase (AlkP superfamily)
LLLTTPTLIWSDTGNLDAVIKACKAVDKDLGELLAAIDKVGENALICADGAGIDERASTARNDRQIALHRVSQMALGTPPQKW